MRIAFDHRLFAAQRFGGISRYFYRLAEGLHGAGEDARVLAPFHCNEYLPHLPRGLVRGRSVAHWPRPLRNRLIRLNPYLADVEMRRWRPQVLHETYYSADALRLEGCARVVTIHDMIHELYPGDFADGGETARYKRLAVERADHVISVSHNTKRDLMEILGTPDSKITVIHHGFDDLVDASEHRTEGDRPFLLYVGHRGGYKNFAGLLRAISASKRLRADFDLVAFGGGALTDSELQLIHDLRFGAGRVRQAGGSDEVLAALYRDAAAFVYPSLYEGFGLPPLEAMARNCPVISSNSSSMPEVIANAARFFDPASTDDMSHAIEAVVYDETARQALIGSGRQRLQVFSWHRCALETMAAYQIAIDQVCGA